MTLSLKEEVLSPGKNNQNDPMLGRHGITMNKLLKINFLPIFIEKVNFLAGQVILLSSLARGK